MLPDDYDAQLRRLFLRLGVRNGLLVGLALALGAWAPDAILLGPCHVRLLYPSLFLCCLALLLLGGLGGWLTSLVGRSSVGGFIWLVVAALMTWTIGHLPYEGRSLTVWLADHRSWGLPIYPFSSPAQLRLVMAGFFIVVLLVILGFLQNYRLEGVGSEIEADGRMSGRAWFLLCLPLPLVLGVGIIANILVSSPIRVAPQLVHEAIRTGRTYSGDLFELSLERGVNYNAIAGVRDQMGARYSLAIGEIELGAASTIFVVADFDNGAWINCRVVANQLSFCYDASPPYLRGFASLLTTGQTPDDCLECAIKVSEELRTWLRARSENFAASPRIVRLAQWGRYVLMRAESPGGDYVVECLFNGLSVVKLERCWEAKTK